MAIALYARKSVEKENSISCETQLEYCKAVLNPDDRKEEILTFVDNGFSGGNTNRVAFQKMMKLIERGRITKLVTYRVDRISRSLYDFVKILETLKKHDVSFVSSQESFNTSSPYGEMIVKLLAVFAEFERNSAIERVTQAYAHRSEKGFYMGGRRPYGFALDDVTISGIKTKMFIPKDVEAEQVKYIFETYAVGNVSLRRLMDNLISNKQLPESGSWSTAKLSTILRNSIYVKADNDVYEYFSRNGAKIISDVKEFDGVHAVQIYGKTKKHSVNDFSDLKVVVMPHEGLISSDLWLKCQKKLEKNKQIGNAISNTSSWLGGKLACKKCGRTMTVTKGGAGTRYFSCTGKSHNRICKGPNVTLYADSLEDMVYELIAEKMDTLKTGRKKIRSDNSNKINLLKNNLSKIKIEQEKLVNLMLTNGLETEMLTLLNGKAKSLAEEKMKTIKKIEELEAEAEEVINVINLSARWKTADFEKKKAVCNLLIHKILISEDGSVEVVWNI